VFNILQNNNYSYRAQAFEIPVYHGSVNVLCTFNDNSDISK